MTPMKHYLTMAGIAGGILGLGGAALVWPAVSERERISEEIASLHERMHGYSGQTTELETLAAEVNELGVKVRSELKDIPAHAEVAQLIRRLSMDVDGVTVLDQTFTAGQSDHASQHESNPAQAMPVTVDMEATFDSIFAMLRNVERTQRLLRVNTLEMQEIEQAEEDADPYAMPLVRAKIGIEAVYLPHPGEER